MKLSVGSGRARGNQPGKRGGAYAGATCAKNLIVLGSDALDRSGPGHGQEGQFNSLENKGEACKTGGAAVVEEGGGWRGVSKVQLGSPCLAPGGTSRGGQSSGSSVWSLITHAHNRAACCGARSGGGVLQCVPQMWPLCLVAPREQRRSVRARASLGSPR